MYIMDAAVCRSYTTDFTNLCIPGANGLDFNLASVIPNVRDGTCSDLLTELFFSCTKSGVSYYNLDLDPHCYADREAFKSCMPGGSAQHTRAPRTCNVLSHLVFLANEGGTFLGGAEKLISIAATYILRRIEVSTCLANCLEDPNHALGDREYPIEASRYGEGFSHLIFTAVTKTIAFSASSVFGGVVGGTAYLVHNYYKSYSNQVNQLLQAPIQQRARNLDFSDAYLQCQKYGETKKGAEVQTGSKTVTVKDGDEKGEKERKADAIRNYNPVGSENLIKTIQDLDETEASPPQIQVRGLGRRRKNSVNQEVSTDTSVVNIDAKSKEEKQSLWGSLGLSSAPVTVQRKGYVSTPDKAALAQNSARLSDRDQVLFERKLGEALGRDPTPEEVKSIMGEAEEKVGNALDPYVDDFMPLDFGGAAEITCGV